MATIYTAVDVLSNIVAAAMADIQSGGPGSGRHPGFNNKDMRDKIAKGIGKTKISKVLHNSATKEDIASVKKITKNYSSHSYPSNLKTEKVDISKIGYDPEEQQDELSNQGVSEYLKDPNHDNTDKIHPSQKQTQADAKTPRFIEHNGKMFVHDGFHRTAAAVLSGKTHIVGKVWRPTLDVKSGGPGSGRHKENFAVEGKVTHWGVDQAHADVLHKYGVKVKSIAPWKVHPGEYSEGTSWSDVRKEFDSSKNPVFENGKKVGTTPDTGVADYKKKIQSGATIHPLIGQTDEKGHLHVEDGHHRYLGAYDAGEIGKDSKVAYMDTSKLGSRLDDFNKDYEKASEVHAGGPGSGRHQGDHFELTPADDNEDSQIAKRMKKIAAKPFNERTDEEHKFVALHDPRQGGLFGGGVGSGRRKEFREELNQSGYRHSHANNKFGNRKRKYGDYLYHQDRDKFEADYKDWLQQNTVHKKISAGGPGSGRHKGDFHVYKHDDPEDVGKYTQSFETKEEALEHIKNDTGYHYSLRHYEGAPPAYVSGRVRAPSHTGWSRVSAKGKMSGGGPGSGRHKTSWGKDQFNRKALFIHHPEYTFGARPVGGARKIGTLDAPGWYFSKKEAQGIADSIKDTPGFENAMPVHFNGTADYTIGWGDKATLSQLHKGGNGHAWLGKNFGISDKSVTSHLKSLKKEKVSLAKDDVAYLKLHAGGPGSGRHKELDSDQPFIAPKVNKFGKAITEPKQLASLRSHVLIKKEQQDLAESMEPKVAKAVKGQQLGKDSEPVDVVAHDAKGKLHGFEVKTLVSKSANNQITMTHGAIPKKNAWATRNKASIHTIVIDARQGQPHSVYYRQGVGSFRLPNMEKVPGGLKGLNAHLASKGINLDGSNMSKTIASLPKYRS